MVISAGIIIISLALVGETGKNKKAIVEKGYFRGLDIYCCLRNALRSSFIFGLVYQAGIPYSAKLSKCQKISENICSMK